MTKAVLYYPSILCGKPYIAEVEVEGRKTTTMFVVEKVGEVKMLVSNRSSVRCPLTKDLRFSLARGNKIGCGSNVHTWRLKEVKE